MTPKQQNMCYPRYKLVTGDSRNVTCPVELTTDDTKNISYCCGNISDVVKFVVRKVTVMIYQTYIIGCKFSKLCSVILP